MNSLAALLIWFAQTTGIPTDDLVAGPPPADTSDKEDAPKAPPVSVDRPGDLDRIYNGI